MKNFFDTKDEKITEKAFSQSLVISVVSILLCLVVLCSMTYAWFSADVSSSSNTLVSGSFDVTISVNDGAISVTEDTNTPGVYRCTLPTADKYTISLTLDGTAKGHCVVTINDKNKNTEAIIGDCTANKDAYAENSPFTFKIETTVADTVVEFRPVWGVVAEPDIRKDGIYSVDLWKEASTQGPEA